MYPAPVRHPSILIPYAGPSDDPNVQDIAIYLRPEANGVKVESTILKVIHKNQAYQKTLQIVYLANLPGDFIVAKHVIEEHYAVKIHFCRLGKEAFTQTMKSRFTEHFALPFDEAPVIGAFEALKKLGLSEEELFRLRVPEEDFTKIHRQSVKRYNGYYIVNYDIPALLHKNSAETDVFSMIIRSFLPYTEFHKMINTINLMLEQEKIITNPGLYSHVFHYSKGPFEQILDGIGYVYEEGDRHIPLQSLSFFRYLLARGIDEKQISVAVHEPIMLFRMPDGSEREMHLFEYTFEDAFSAAFEKFQSRIEA
jgi:hypothetical protein